MIKKIVLFDIDYTLFNGKTFRDTLWQDLGKQLLQSPNAFQATAEEVYLSLRDVMAYFDPILFAQTLAKHLDIVIKEKEVEKLVIDLSESGSFLYEEVKPIFEQLHKQENVEIGIFSTGFFHLQKAKLTPLLHVIKEEHIHIFNNKKLSLFDTIQKYKNEKLFLVDDFYQLLQKAKEIDPSLTAIWIKRGRHAEKIQNTTNFIPDYSLETLHKVVSIIDNG